MKDELVTQQHNYARAATALSGNCSSNALEVTEGFRMVREGLEQIIAALRPSSGTQRQTTGPSPSPVGQTPEDVPRPLDSLGPPQPHPFRLSLERLKKTEAETAKASELLAGVFDSSSSHTPAPEGGAA